jgi:hypothetical protein
MPQNFIGFDREQAFLMPLSSREWPPEDHLAWFVIQSIERLDLAAFYASIDRMGTAGRRMTRR